MYYFKSYGELLKSGAITEGDLVDFTVPTGNFGDILAGYLAKKMGLPVGKLICASNENNILTDFLSTGKYDKNRTFFKTSSPSMDILVSSNLERLLYLESGADSAYIKEIMDKLSSEGVYEVKPEILESIQKNFGYGFTTEEETRETIGKVWKENGYLLDPHTAVAWHVAENSTGEGKASVVLSTASPYKFPKVVLESIGGVAPEDAFEVMNVLHEVTGVPIPKNLATLKEKKVRFTDVENKESLYEYVIKEIEAK